MSVDKPEDGSSARPPGDPPAASGAPSGSHAAEERPVSQPPGSRRLAPPPKPRSRREGRPSAEPGGEEGEDPSIPPAPRVPALAQALPRVSVRAEAETSRPPARAGSQPSIRRSGAPRSEPPRPRGSEPPSAETPRSSSDSARAKLEPLALKFESSVPRSDAPRPRSDVPLPRSDAARVRAPSSPALSAKSPGRAAAPTEKSEPAVSSAAIRVMKIIAIGGAGPMSSEPPTSTSEIPAPFEPAAPPPAPVPVSAPAPAEPAPAVEIPVAAPPAPPAEPAPVAAPAPAAAVEADTVELGRDDAISVPPGEVDVASIEPPAAAPDSQAEVPKPPPPPRRKSPSSHPKPLPTARRKQRRAWWEDAFGEDFVRSTLRMSDAQIRREVDFIEESLGVAAGGVVLDLACGAGHHAVELASRGYGLVGYDLSLYQLALAAEVAQGRSQKINFLQGDMREMDFEESFDGVFCWDTSFGYFEEEKNVAVAQKVFASLRSGGMFLLDVINRDFAAKQSPCQIWYEGDACVCMDDMSLDYITSRLRVKRSVILDDGATHECNYSIRAYSMHELGKLLHEVGFRVTEASGHPATPGVFFGDHSPRVIMLAQKP